MAAREPSRRALELIEALRHSDPARRASLLAGAEPGLRAEVDTLLRTLPDIDTRDVLPPLSLHAHGFSLAGSVIGPYRILRELAGGGMGVVYLAERDDIEKRVALKLVREGRLASPVQVRRFLLERKVLARLEHPNIARLLDAGVTETGMPYLVMEYVEGEPIDRYCDARRLDVTARLRLFVQVCAAVEYAHAQGIVHRDLKPGNLLVSAPGEVKLLDFGIAKLLEARSADPTLTRGLILATPEYASPEQIRGEPVTAASDVFALGIVLYELLSGHHPYRRALREGASAEQVIGILEPPRPSVAVRQRETVRHAAGGAETITPERVADLRATSPARLRLQLRGDLDDIVGAALATQPSQRHASVAALQADIERFLAGLPPLAGRAAGLSRRWRRPRWLEPRPVSLALAAAAVALLGIGAALAPRTGQLAQRLMNRPPALALSPAAVAVLPFAVHGGAEFGYLREGLAELVSRALDGAGELHSVDTRALLGLETGLASLLDAQRGGEIARAFGAALFVLGDVAEVRGRLRLSARLYDARREGRYVARSEVEGDAAELFGLVDNLVMGLIAGRYGTPGERLVRVAATTTTSLAALKAYLDGEAHARASRYGLAVEAFQQATALDTTFALAHYRLSAAASSTNQTQVMHTAAEAAVRHGARLSPRDRLLLRAYLSRLDGDIERAEAIYRQILHDHSDDVQAAYELADLMFHNNPFRGRSVLQARPGFERAIRLGLTNREALDHALKLAALAGDHVQLDSLEARVRANNPRDALLLLIPYFRAALRGDNDAQEQVLAAARPMGDMSVFVWTVWTGVFTRSRAAVERLAHVLTEPERASEVRAFGHLTLADLAVTAGQRAPAWRELQRAGRLAPLRALEVEGAYLALPFMPTADEELRSAYHRLGRWEAAGAPPPLNPPFLAFYHDGWDRAARLYVLGLLAARRRDDQAALGHATALEALDGPPATRAYAADLAHGVRARLAWEHGRPEQALALLEQIHSAWPKHFTPVHANSLGAERFLRAEALFHLGREEEALSWYDTIAELAIADFVYLAPAHLRQGEIHERLGDRARAAEHYARVVELWRDCDPELRPLRERAEQRLEALRG